MGVMRRNNSWYIRWWFENKDRWIKTYAKSKLAAEKLERECRTAMDIKDFSILSAEAREILVRFYKTMGRVAPIALFPVEQENRSRYRALEQRKSREGCHIKFFSTTR